MIPSRVAISYEPWRGLGRNDRLRSYALFATTGEGGNAGVVVRLVR